MWLSEFLRDQFGSPSGLFGSLVVVPFLNLANIGLIRDSIELLELREKDQVLDIGFGGGWSLVALAERLPKGRVVGLDHSRDMIAAATHLVRERELQRRVRLYRGDLLRLPFADASFDRVLTVNTIYYWPDLSAPLRDIARVLKPGGRLVLAFRSPATLWLATATWDKFRRNEPEEVAAVMRKDWERPAGPRGRQGVWSTACPC
jgi:arsenite methyltransferase